jgi:hypothetical protein
MRPIQSTEVKNASQRLCDVPVRDRSLSFALTSSILVVTGAVVLLIRLVYAKFFSCADLDRSDLSVFLVFLLCIPSLVTNFEMTKNGLGRDMWTLSPDEITRFAIYFWIGTIIYFIELALLKLSIIFFFLRIFPGKTIRRVLWATVVFITAFGIAFLFAATFECTPVSYTWIDWLGEGGGTCVNIAAIAWANAAVNIALDL